MIDAVLKDQRLQDGLPFDCLAETLSSWEAKADMEKDDEPAHSLEKVLLNFWERLSEICFEKMNEPEADVKSVLGVCNLLRVLQKPKSLLKSNKKKVGKVRFADEMPESHTENEKYFPSEGENSEGWELVAEPLLSHNCSDLVSPLRKKPLEDLVCRLAGMSMNFVKEQKSEQHLRFLSTLLSSFSSTQVFKTLLGDERQSIAKSKPPEIAELIQKNPAVQFLYQKLLGWLNEDQRQDSGFLVDILYSALRCCDDDKERKDVLDDLTEVFLLRLFQLDWLTQAPRSQTWRGLGGTFGLFLDCEFKISSIVTVSWQVCETSRSVLSKYVCGHDTSLVAKRGVGPAEKVLYL